MKENYNILQRLKKELEYLVGDPELEEAYEKRIIEIKNMIEEIELEYKRGIEEGIKRIVLNMRDEQMQIEDICKYTKLAKEDVQKLLENE